MRTSNFFSVTGNLGGPVELRESNSGTDVARLSVAETIQRPNSQTGVYEQVHTNWFPITAFGSLAKSQFEKGAFAFMRRRFLQKDPHILRVCSGPFTKTSLPKVKIPSFQTGSKRAARSLKAGDRVTILGTFKTSIYEKDGENRRGFEVVADSIEKTELLAKAAEFDPAIGSAMPPFDEFSETKLGFDPMKVK